MRNKMNTAPTMAAIKTDIARSFCLVIAMSPVIKADIPEANPPSIVSARAGLLAISANIVSPAGTDPYNEFVKDVPTKNNNGIAIISPSDHFPNMVFGINSPGFVHP